jgi:hypothetical protein
MVTYCSPTALQLEQQARFEVEAFNEGVKRYREAIAGSESWAGTVGDTVKVRRTQSDLTELTAGQKLLVEIVPGLSARIGQAQATALAAINGKGAASHPPPWAWYIGLVDDPDKLAVITLGCVLAFRLDHDDGGYRLDRQSAPITSLARNIASAVKMQVEFDRWSGENPALEKKLRALYPNVHRNVWARWRRKVDALRTEPWEPGAEVHLGTCLIDCLLAAAPSRFKTEHLPVRGKRTAHLTISDETIEFINDVTTRAEVARPLLMPMICPPIPWRYEE